MRLDLLHPRDQITMILSRIYRGGMTTTSGGNLSVREPNGDIWITPAGVDKGTLSPRDIVCVRADGGVEGLHRPSSELPFHQAIYACREDLRAIVHAHPPALVAFSIVRQIPDTRVIPQARHVCGPIGYAPYELPGSPALGQSIAGVFCRRHNAVIMENHGVVVGGDDLFDAFQRFETLEFCARTIINARKLGQVQTLTDEQVQQFEHADYLLPEFAPGYPAAEERSLRSEICRFIRRACDQGLMISTYGTLSARCGDDFLITPTGIDRRCLEPEDVVLIREGRREQGKLPSRSVLLHREIYAAHPHVGSIITTQSPNATAFCVSGRTFDTHTIPESYILLKEVSRVPFGMQFSHQHGIAEVLSAEAPTLLIQNDAVLVTGGSILETFDRLEVAEFSARSLVESVSLGDMAPIDEAAIEDLRQAFFPQS